MIAEHADAAGLAVPRVILEPGRALTSDTQFLLTSVVDVNDGGDLAHAVLDAGINVAEPVPNEFHQLFSVVRPGGRGDVALPPRRADLHARRRAVQPLAAAAAGAGHVLAIMDSGAYFVPFSTTLLVPASRRSSCSTATT